MKAKPTAGIPTRAICNIAGVKQPTLSLWKSKGIVFPTVRQIQGRGGDLWSFGDFVEVKAVVKLKEIGLTLQRSLKVTAWLRKHGHSLDSVILRIAGDTIEPFSSEGAAWDVLKRQGQGVFMYWQSVINAAKAEYATHKVELKQTGV